MIAQLLVLAVFPALLAAAAGWDLVSYTIPNLIPIALVVTFGAYALAMHMALPVLGLHLAVGFGGLALGFGLFAFGIIGGGDAKLLEVAQTILEQSVVANSEVCGNGKLSLPERT